MSVLSRSIVAAMLLGAVGAAFPAAAAVSGQNRLEWLQIAQYAQTTDTASQSKTDPRKPGEPPAAAQPPQEGHSPLR